MKTPLEVAIEQYRMQKPRGKLPRAPRMLFPSAAERTYRKRMLQLVAEARLMFARMSEAVQPERIDAIGVPVSTVEKFIRRYESGVSMLFGAAAMGIAKEMAQTVNNHNFEQMRKQFSRLTPMDVLQFTPEMTDKIVMAADQNAKLIVDVGDSIKNNVARAVSDGFIKGKRWEAIAEEVTNGLDGYAGVFHKATTRAALIARDQVATLNGTLTKDRNESLGINLYEWQTAGDARVRDSHRDINGKVFSWNGTVESGGKTYTEAPGGIFPGSEINCRCVAAPVFVED